MTEEDEAFNEIERRSKVKQTLIETLPKQEGQSNFCQNCEALARELKAIEVKLKEKNT